MAGRLDRGESTGGGAIGLHPLIKRPQSFAEVVAILERLNALDAALASAIAGAQVPPSEVRALLLAETKGQAENVAAFQFLRQIFLQVGLPLTVEAVGRFSLTFGVEDTAYARLFAGERPGKTCAFVSEALARFLGGDFGLPAAVEEVACRNAGDGACLFAAALDPLAVRVLALDATDWALLTALGRAPQDLATDLGLTRDELDARLERLIGYGLAAADGRRLPDGDAVLARGAPSDDFEPPWRDASRISRAIADAESFAQALVQVAPKESRGAAHTDAKTNALAAECRSFAELLARASRERSFE